MAVFVALICFLVFAYNLLRCFAAGMSSAPDLADREGKKGCIYMVISFVGFVIAVVYAILF